MKLGLYLGFIISIVFLPLHRSSAQTKAKSFYLSPSSPFPSGQINVKDLERNKIKSEFEYSFLVSAPVGRFWLSEKQFIRDINLSRWVYHTAYKQIFSIKEAKGSWIVVEDDKKNEKIFPLSELTPYIADLGFATNNLILELKQKPNFNSKTLKLIPAFSKFEILEFNSPWVKIKDSHKNQATGFVLIQDIISKADLANFVQTPKGEWRAVLGKRGIHLTLDKGELLPISQVKAWHTSRDHAILTQPYEELKISAKSKVKIEKSEAKIWHQSRIKGHGLVYWNENLSHSENATIPQKGYWTTEDVLKKDIHAIAVHPLNPHVALISAGGIFLTLNGENWRQLENFKDQNLPINIGPEGQLFVGTTWSTDEGKTFTPFIKWEKLTKLIEAETKHSPKLINLKQIHYTTDSRVSLEIDTGNNHILISGLPESSSTLDWSLTTN